MKLKEHILAALSLLDDRYAAAGSDQDRMWIGCGRIYGHACLAAVIAIGCDDDEGDDSLKSMLLDPLGLGAAEKLFASANKVDCQAASALARHLALLPGYPNVNLERSNDGHGLIAMSLWGPYMSTSGWQKIVSSGGADWGLS